MFQASSNKEMKQPLGKSVLDLTAKIVPLPILVIRKEYIKFGCSLDVANVKRICMGKVASHPQGGSEKKMECPFPIQILSIFLRLKLLPKFIFQCYRYQTWQVPVLFMSGIHEVSGILKFNVGSSHLPTQTWPSQMFTGMYSIEVFNRSGLSQFPLILRLTWLILMEC